MMKIILSSQLTMRIKSVKQNNTYVIIHVVQSIVGAWIVFIFSLLTTYLS